MTTRLHSTPCSRLQPRLLPDVGARRGLHCNIPALHRAGRLHQQSTMLLSGAFGSAAGYANFIVKIAIFTASVSSMIDMFYLRNSTCHALLFSTRFIFMITLMVYHFDKRIYDIMIFLLTSILRIKLNMNLSKFLTQIWSNPLHRWSWEEYKSDELLPSSIVFSLFPRP